MNRFAKNIIYVFLCDDNYDYLNTTLNNFFIDNKEIKEYLASDLRRRMLAFSARIQRELSVSDPMEGTTIRDQVLAYNTQFLKEMRDDIEKSVLPNLTPLYSVAEKRACNGRTSARPTSSIANNRQTGTGSSLSADDLLKKWNDNPGALDQFRDDTQGDFRESDRNTKNNRCYNPMYDIAGDYCVVASGTSRYCGNASTGWGLRTNNTYKNPRDVYEMPKQSLTAPSTYVPRNNTSSIFVKSREYKEGFGDRQQGAVSDRSYGGIGEPQHIGVDYCDQSEVGNSSYYDRQFNTFYSQHLNSDPQKHTLQPFGYSTAASDERLLNRRIFRNNEAGVENGISRYEVRLQRRNLDRDNGETFADTQYDYQTRGHDMGDLIARTNAKQYLIDKPKFSNALTDKLRYSDIN